MKYLRDRHSIHKLFLVFLLTSLLLSSGGSNAAPPDTALIPVTGPGSSYYVSMDGSDSNPGSEAQPWQSIQKAVKSVVAGDTVYVRGGQYNGIHYGWRFQNSGTQARPITFTNYPGEQVVFKHTAVTDIDYDMFDCWVNPHDPPSWPTPKADYIRIVGTDVTPRLLSDGVESKKGVVIQGLPGEQSYDIFAGDCDYWEVAGVDFVETAGGIRTSKNSWGTTEEHSSDNWYVHDNRVYIFYRESGMQFNGDNNRIENNEIYKVTNRVDTPYGCQLFDFLGHHNIIKGNTLSRLGSTAGCAGILFEWDLADTNTVEGNRIFDVRLGIQIAGGDNNVIRNNIIYASSIPETFSEGIEILSYDNSVVTNWPCSETLQAQFLLPADNPVSPDYQYYYNPRNCYAYGNQIYNNTIHGFVEGIHVCPSVGQATVIRNNVFSGWTRAAICYNQWSNGTCKPLPTDLVADHNAIQGDFGFVDLASYNFHLAATSSLINAGYDLGSLNQNDFEGNARPGGAGYDIGAYQLSPVTISGNLGVAGATLSYTDGGAKTVTSAADGSYSFSVSPNWTGAVTPSKTGYTFGPPNKPYANVIADQPVQNYTAQPMAYADVNVSIGSLNAGSYGVPSGGQATSNYPNLFNGAVRVASTNATHILVSERQIFGSSFSESMGIPGDRLTTEYWFPWYDGMTMRTWITIGAPSSNSGDASVDVYIGNSGIPVGSYSVAPGSQVHPDFPGVFDGAVRIVSTNAQDIFASERQIYGDSFSETMGIPSNHLDTEYWFPLYDAQTMRTWISIGAPDTNVGDATVEVYVAGTLMGTYTVAPGGQAHPIYTGTHDGPVRVLSTGGQQIFVSERQIYGSSFSESLGVPSGDLTTQYYFPWYDGMTMSTALSLGAPSSNTGDASVDVYIGGVYQNTYTVPSGGRATVTYPGTFNGAVDVRSTNSQNIFVSERQIFGSSFAETMAIAANQLTTEYWFPWYDGLTMRTWVSVGAP